MKQKKNNPIDLKNTHTQKHCCKVKLNENRKKR